MRAEPPWAWSNHDVEAQPGEAVQRRADRAGAESPSYAGGASLVGIERFCYALVQRIGRREVDATGDGEGDQDGAARPGTGGERPSPSGSANFA